MADLASAVRVLGERGLDLLLDPRLPQGAPYQLYRRLRYGRFQAPGPAAAPAGRPPLRICLSFDVEHDYQNPAGHASSLRFMPEYLARARSRGWHGTLYVQGALVPDLKPWLQQAQADHELGLHGLYHEVWGRSRWWQFRQGHASITAAQKKLRLQTALALFREAGLAAPRSFRAPYLNADRTTLRLLAQCGFTSDSSPATYLGALPWPRPAQGLQVIPVTAAPLARRSGRLQVYPELAAGALHRMDRAALHATVDAALRAQAAHAPGVPAHLVVLAHPWEFEHTRGVAHASPALWDELDTWLGWLAEHYQLRYHTISQLLAPAEDRPVPA